MKALLLWITIAVMVSSTVGYSTLFHSHPDTILNNLKEGNWNVYVIYFYSDKQNDQSLKNNVINNAVAYFGDDVMFTEVNVSKQGYAKVLDAIEFDTGRDKSLSGSTTFDQLPFVLEVVHGYGYIINGANAHKSAYNHIKELAEIGQDKSLESYN